MMAAGRKMRKALSVLLSFILIISVLVPGCSKLMQMNSDNHDYTPIYSSQDLFNQIYNELYRFEEDVYVETSSYDEFMSYWNDLDHQFALHSAFRGRDIQISRMEKKDVCRVKMHMQFNPCGQAMQYLYAKTVKDYPSEEARTVGEALLAIKNEIITDDMTEDEKVKKIHDYLIMNCAYALDMDAYTYNDAGSLVQEGLSQCQGYSEAFTALCLLCGIESRVISGNSTFGFGEGAHAWCQVKVNYIWYHIDVTWDDPIPDQPGVVRYDFYLKGDSMMRMTHQWCPYFEECYVDYTM
ncbi:MAG: hypothetical protein J6Y58_06225 [Clostridiales bacterium]|nr:hypothetical protein [Clostridiales bacterium]